MIHRTKKEEWRHRRGPKEEKAKSKEEKTTNAEKDWGKQGIFFNIQVSITSFKHSLKLLFILMFALQFKVFLK